jgi:hypothetical protein
MSHEAWRIRLNCGRVAVVRGVSDLSSKAILSAHDPDIHDLAAALVRHTAVRLLCTEQMRAGNTNVNTSLLRDL